MADENEEVVPPEDNPEDQPEEEPAPEPTPRAEQDPGSQELDEEGEGDSVDESGLPAPSTR